MANKKTSHTAQIGIGLAATTAVATAAGAYFLYGAKNATKNRKKVKGWMLKAKGEVLEGLEKAKNLDEKSYHDLIDNVMKKYRKMRVVSDKEAAELRRELKGHWKNLHKNVVALKPKKAKKKSTTKKKVVVKKTTKRKTTKRKK